VGQRVGRVRVVLAVCRWYCGTTLSSTTAGSAPPKVYETSLHARPETEYAKVPYPLGPV